MISFEEFKTDVVKKAYESYQKPVCTDMIKDCYEKYKMGLISIEDAVNTIVVDSAYWDGGY